jgi:nitroreductase
MAEKGEVKAPEIQDWTPVEQAILERRSVRKYKDKQVPENLIKRILESGRFAPSAGNCQPWKLVVVRDKAMLDEMEKDTLRMCKFFKFFLDWRKPGILGKISWLYAQVFIRIRPKELHPIPFGAISAIAEGKLKLFHGAPTVIFILKDKRGVSNPDLDCGICGQNIVLSAYSLGLSTCWIGFTKLLGYLPKWRKRLNIQYPYDLIEGIAIGYPVGNPNGMIERETHEIDWYENGVKTTVY